MSDYPELDHYEDAGRVGRVVALLDILGWLALAGGVAIGILLVWQFYLEPAPENRQMASAFGGMAALLLGAVSMASLWGLAELIRRSQQVEEIASELAASSSPTGADMSRHSGTLPTSDHTFDELVLLIREVRDISLLTTDQRSLRLQAQGRVVLGRLRKEVPMLLREHNWIEARNRIESARERFPQLSEWDEMDRKVEELRAKVESEDVENAERQIKDLMALGAWDRVDEVVREMIERHPDSTRANDIAHKIRDEHNRAQAEQRAKYMARAQEAVNAREWRTALQLANKTITRFPKSPEAHALRLQLPVLIENAQIKERMDWEEEFQSHLRARRFPEALRIAMELIEKYPESQQADILREQLPKLEERASAGATRR